MKPITTLNRTIRVTVKMTEQRMDAVAEEMNRVCSEEEFMTAEERKEYVAAHTPLLTTYNPIVKGVRNFRNLAVIEFKDGSKRTVSIFELDRAGITQTLLDAVR